MTLLVAIALIALFHVGLSTGFLGKMPGPRWAEHFHFILFIGLPLSWWTYPIFVLAITIALDDAVQHYRIAHGRPQYKSWLHLNGWWYVQRPVFQWLKIGG